MPADPNLIWTLLEPVKQGSNLFVAEETLYATNQQLMCCLTRKSPVEHDRCTYQQEPELETKAMFVRIPADPTGPIPFSLADPDNLGQGQELLVAQPGDQFHTVINYLLEVLKDPSKSRLAQELARLQELYTEGLPVLNDKVAIH